MGVSRIEQLIEDIYEFIESCKMQPLSQTKVVVPKDELYDLLDELKLRLPDEIKRYQKIIANRDAILSDAEKKSDDIQKLAKQQMEQMVNEHEIVQQAYQQANEIMTNATNQAHAMLASANSDANQIRVGALAYTNEMLTEVEHSIADALDSTRAKSDSLLASLKGNLDIVISNRKELCEQINPQFEDRSPNPQQNYIQEESGDFSEEFNVDVDSYLTDND